MTRTFVLLAAFFAALVVNQAAFADRLNGPSGSTGVNGYDASTDFQTNQ